MPLLLLTLKQKHRILARIMSNYQGQSARCKTYQMHKFCPSSCHPESTMKMETSLPISLRCTIKPLSHSLNRLLPHSIINRQHIHWLLRLWIQLLTIRHWHNQHITIRVLLHSCLTLFLSSLQWLKSLPQFHKKGRMTVITKMVWSSSIWITQLVVMPKADMQRVL